MGREPQLDLLNGVPGVADEAIDSAVAAIEKVTDSSSLSASHLRSRRLGSTAPTSLDSRSRQTTRSSS